MSYSDVVLFFLCLVTLLIMCSVLNEENDGE